MTAATTTQLTASAMCTDAGAYLDGVQVGEGEGALPRLSALLVLLGQAQHALQQREVVIADRGPFALVLHLPLTKWQGEHDPCDLCGDGVLAAAGAEEVDRAGLARQKEHATRLGLGGGLGGL